MVDEFAPASERVTAVITQQNGTDESYGGPLTIGYYPKGGGEIWLECEGGRVNIQAEHFRDVMRQLRRANKIATAED
jgi:hypothetical protein